MNEGTCLYNVFWFSLAVLIESDTTHFNAETSYKRVGAGPSLDNPDVVKSNFTAKAPIILLNLL